MKKLIVLLIISLLGFGVNSAAAGDLYLRLKNNDDSKAPIGMSVDPGEASHMASVTICRNITACGKKLLPSGNKK